MNGNWSAVTLLIATLCAPALLAAPAPRTTPAEPGALETLVKAERSFASLSLTSGMKQSFLANLCEDGITFRPGPVNGRESWLARSNPHGVLRWAPAFAEASADGDIGYTTGPWDFGPDSVGAPPFAFGHFVSVWKRGPEGEWCVALDIGISHERVNPGVDSVEFRAGPKHAQSDAPKQRTGRVRFGFGLFGGGGSGLGVGVGTGDRWGTLDEQERALAHETNQMLTAERALAFDVRRMGVGRAYPKHAAADLRCYQEGALPTTGITPAITAREARPREIELRLYGRGLSTSLDLGYTYGLIELRPRGAAQPDTSAYMHVWRRTAEGGWELALDIESPYPKR